MELYPGINYKLTLIFYLVKAKHLDVRRLSLFARPDIPGRYGLVRRLTFYVPFNHHKHIPKIRRAYAV
jgi:hypothetical protein